MFIFNYFYLISCLWITLKSLIMLCLVQIVIIHQMTSCFQPKCFELVNRITGNKHVGILCLCTNVTCLLITATKKNCQHYFNLVWYLPFPICRVLNGFNREKIWLLLTEFICTNDNTDCRNLYKYIVTASR